MKDETKPKKSGKMLPRQQKTQRQCLKTQISFSLQRPGRRGKLVCRVRIVKGKTVRVGNENEPRNSKENEIMLRK